MANAKPSPVAGSNEAPRHAQLSRAKGWKMPPNTVKVDRTTRWGNPFAIGRCVDDIIGESSAEFIGVAPWVTVRDADHAVELYRLWWAKNYPNGPHVAPSIKAARGKNLACWCKIGEPCHADVLLELANCNE